MPKSLLVVFSNPAAPDQEKAYNRWYSQKHLRDVVSVTGFISATRYRIDKDVSLSGGTVQPNKAAYLAIYELEAKTTEELQSLSDALAAAIEAGKVDMDSSLDVPSLEASFVVPITETVG